MAGRPAPSNWRQRRGPAVEQPAASNCSSSASPISVTGRTTTTSPRRHHHRRQKMNNDVDATRSEDDREELLQVHLHRPLLEEVGEEGQTGEDSIATFSATRSYPYNDRGLAGRREKQP